MLFIEVVIGVMMISEVGYGESLLVFDRSQPTMAGFES